MKQIVERCQQGDREAFGQLYTLTYDRLRQMCRRYVSNESTIDDLLHDAYLLIFTKIGSLKDASKADAWMQRVVQNLALAYANHAKQQTVVALDCLQEPPAISETPPPIDYEEIMSLIGQLPESYQRVFRLSVFEGLSHQEIAELLNHPPVGTAGHRSAHRTVASAGNHAPTRAAKSRSRKAAEVPKAQGRDA